MLMIKNIEQWENYEMVWTLSMQITKEKQVEVLPSEMATSTYGL